jgi:transcriptional regulator with XRE-family HTH domain
MPELVINPIAAEIGERIRSYREQHGLSQKQLGEETGILPSQICRYEKGTEVPGSGTLARLAAFMGCTLDYLYYGRVEQIVAKIDALLREPFMELHDFSEECRRAVYESAYAHMSRETMLKRAGRNPDTGILPGKPKKGRNES